MSGRLCQARHSTLQAVQHSPVEGFRLLDVAEVSGGGDEHELRAWGLGVHDVADLWGCQPVVLAEHEQRREGDLVCVGMLRWRSISVSAAVARSVAWTGRSASVRLASL